MKLGGKTSSGHDLRYYALSFAIIIPLFRPRSISQFESIERVFYLGQILFAMAVGFYMLVRILSKKTRAFSTIAWMVIFYKAWETLAIYKNGCGDFSTLVNATGIIGATILTEYMLKKAPAEYLFTLSFYTGLLVLTNNISYCTGGFSGVTDATGNIVYFWSTRNHLSSLFFIALISSFIYNGIARTSVSFLGNLFVLSNVIWGTIAFQSATTIVGIACYIVLYILFMKRAMLYQPVKFYLGGLGLHIAIVILRVQEIFSYLIENLLQRSLTMSGRTMIWDTALLFLVSRPVWGYGQSSIFAFTFAKSEIPAHNQILDVGIVCGIPGIILFVLMFWVAFRLLKNYRNSMVARIICCSLLSYVVMSISESPNPYQPWYILLGMISLIPDIDKRYTYISYKLTSRGVLRRKRVKGNM